MRQVKAASSLEKVTRFLGRLQTEGFVGKVTLSIEQGGAITHVETMARRMYETAHLPDSGDDDILEYAEMKKGEERAS